MRIMSITVDEFQLHLVELLGKVKAGQIISLTERGGEIALLVPPGEGVE